MTYFGEHEMENKDVAWQGGGLPSLKPVYCHSYSYKRYYVGFWTLFTIISLIHPFNTKKRPLIVEICWKSGRLKSVLKENPKWSLSVQILQAAEFVQRGEKSQNQVCSSSPHSTAVPTIFLKIALFFTQRLLIVHF